MTVRQDLTAANSRIGNTLVTGAGRLASQAFSNLGSWRDDDVARYIKQIGPSLSGIKLQAAKSTVAFYKAMADLTGQDFTQPVITASDLTTQALRKGVGTDLVYSRPFVDMRTVLSKGGSMTDAIAAGARRAQSLASTEVQLARRNAGLIARNANDGIVGYIRTLTGFENCALCYVASTQRYTRGDLMPIHPGCDCGEMPIYGTQDPGQVINEARLEAVHENVSKRFGVSARDARELDYRAIKITEHGEMGPVLTIRGQKSLAAGDVGELFGKTRVTTVSNELPDIPYTRSSHDALIGYSKTDYRYINAGLRSDFDPSFRNVPTGRALESTKQRISDIDKAMEISYLSENATLYRGAYNPEIRDLDIEAAQKLIGQIIEDKGFVSTTTSKSVMTTGSFSADPFAIEFIIKAPKGTKAIDMVGTKSTGFDFEAEVLLNRGLRYKIIDVYEKDLGYNDALDRNLIRRYVEMEVLPNE